MYSSKAQTTQLGCSRRQRTKLDTATARASPPAEQTYTTGLHLGLPFFFGAYTHCGDWAPLGAATGATGDATRALIHSFSSPCTARAAAIARCTHPQRYSHAAHGTVFGRCTPAHPKKGRRRAHVVCAQLGAPVVRLFKYRSAAGRAAAGRAGGSRCSSAGVGHVGRLVAHTLR